MSVKETAADSHLALGFLGAGNMAKAIARGAVRAGLCQPGDIVFSAPSEKNRTPLAAEGFKTTARNTEVLAARKVVVIAVKPQVFPAVSCEIGSDAGEGTLLISVMAGLTTANITKAIGAGASKLRLVKAMPNTPLSVGLGATALCAGPRATAADMKLARRLFAAAGVVEDVDEDQMDAACAVAGSGPAYVFLLAEALEAAAQDLGLAQAEARALVAQTLLGAATLMQGGAEPAELRKAVTSPGGTTEAAIRSLESGHFRDLMLKALRANVARGKALRGE